MESPFYSPAAADDKTDMDTKNKEAEARSLKAVVRDTLMRPVFYLDTSLFPGSSFLISTPASGLGFVSYLMSICKHLQCAQSC